METKQDVPGKKPANSLLVAVLFLIGIIAFDILLVMATPEEDAAGVFWFILLSLFFAMLLVVVIVYGRLQKRMIREMKTPLDASAARDPDPVRDEKTTPPPHRFAYRLFDGEIPIQSSPKATGMFEQAQTNLQQFKTNLMFTALFIWAWYLPLGGILLFVPEVLPGASSLFCGAPILLLVAFLAANPKQGSAEKTILVWGGLNLLGVGVIVLSLLSGGFRLLLGRGSVAALLLLIILAVTALVSYAVFHLYLGSRIRRHTTASQGMRLLILWVFGPQQNLLTILGDIGRFWRYFGSVQFLQGGEYTLDMQQVLSYMGGNRRLLVRTQEELDAKLRTFRNTPKWGGEFPAHSLLCGDAVWKRAVEAFLCRADLVAMNLCGFSRTNQGCLYELALLTDRFPTWRTIFLVDDQTEMDFLLETLQHNWETMPAHSPNHVEMVTPVAIYKLRPSNPADMANLLKLFFEIAASPAPVTKIPSPAG